MRHASVLLALLAGSSAGRLAAQDKVVELGQDVGFTVAFNGATVRSLSVPSGSVRVGVFVSPMVAVEPEVALTHLSVEDAGSVTTLSLSVSLPIHFVRERHRIRPYVRPLAGVTAVDAEGGASQVQAGAGFGIKSPITERLGARLEALVVRAFESEELAAATVIGLRLGFSFFTS
jgi:hypothetical protein